MKRTLNATHTDALHTTNHLARKTYDAKHQVTFLICVFAIHVHVLLMRWCDQPVLFCFVFIQLSQGLGPQPSAR
jgi:hypothetical protein